LAQPPSPFYSLRLSRLRIESIAQEGPPKITKFNYSF